MTFPLNQEAIKRMTLEEIIEWTATLEAEFTIRRIEIRAQAIEEMKKNG